MFYKIFLKPFLFLFDAESIHNVTLKFFSGFTLLYPVLKFIYSPKDVQGIEIKDLKFKNRLGLAAGFDKNGAAIRFWESLGFSHAEIGTVTPLPQPGNPKPRIFRLKEDKAIINRLGFNNKGADEVKKNILKARKYVGKDFVIGVNIGKNKNTPIKEAVNDYRICFEKLYDAADYFTVNISSPNTVGLRKLQEEEFLDELLSEIRELNVQISLARKKDLKCIFLKIAPDIDQEMIEKIYELVKKNQLTGIIATNTTVERSGLRSGITEQGGMSGKPLKPRADEVLKTLNGLNEDKEDKNDKLILIGVGGVFDKEDYNDKIRFGSSLVQVYTGFIYEGPSVIKKILS